MHLLGVATLGAMALASCNSGGGGGDRSATGAVAAGGYSQTPGEYETTVRVVSHSLNGFPPEAQEQLNRMQQQPLTQKQCVPVGLSFDSIDMRNVRIQFPENAGACNLAELSQTGGNAKMALNCEIRNLPQQPNMPTAVNVSANFEGTYQQNEWRMTGRGELTVPGDDSRKGNVELEMSTRRVGDCPSPAAYSSTPMTPSAPPSTMDMNGSTGM